jgi:tetratricopeptide (TPR) repeat protein
MAALRDAVGREPDVALLLQIADAHHGEEFVWRPALLRVLEIEPENLGALTRLGQKAWLQGDNVEAYACWQRADKIDPHDLHTLSLKAALSTDWDEMIQINEEILSRYPEHPAAAHARRNIERARSYSASGRPNLSWPPGQHPPDA